jgi:hypothetical protein
MSISDICQRHVITIDAAATLREALRNGIARETSERPAISPPRPRPAFLPHGTPGMQEPAGYGVFP